MTNQKVSQAADKEQIVSLKSTHKNLATDLVLSVKNLSVKYLTEDKHVNAVKDVSFQIHQKEVFALVGESGCGKSTLIQALLRTLGPPGVISGGQAYLDGVNLLEADAQQLAQIRWAKISLVPQSAMSALNPVLTIGTQFKDVFSTNLSDQLDKKSLEEKIASLLSLVALAPEVQFAYPHELSGGMRQRVAIALALALRPQLILMDEPTTALDVLVQKEILQTISRLRHELDFTVLIITHDLPLVLSFADRVGVMRHGTLLTVSEPHAILNKTIHPYVTQLIEASRSEAHPTTENDKAFNESQDKLVNQSLQIDSKEETLIAKGLIKEFGKRGWFKSNIKRVVDDVDLTLYRGETLALIGASGSGKSTIAKLLTLMEPLTQGRLFLGNTELDINEATLAFRQKIQLVFQDPFAALNAVHKIEHHLLRPLRLHFNMQGELAREKALELLETVGLTPGSQFIDRYPYELSGGQRQRVCIARALACEPQILIADEPTSMLDVSIRQDLLGLLAQLQSSHQLSILLITHDLLTAQSLADRVMVLKDGRIVEYGSATAVFQRPQHEYTKALFAATPQLSRTPLAK